MSAADVEAARELATLRGNRQHGADIRAVQVGVPCPLLERLVLIDSPGVGGLESGNAELALQSLWYVDALLFVTDAAADWTAAELQFLRRAAARTDTVLVALSRSTGTGEDQAPGADKAAALHRDVPELQDCPTVAVDTPLALRALARALILRTP